jgi:phenylpropionate dioxygenase-like ring-hydroxylating dioxygenase large terminal subunit
MPIFNNWKALTLSWYCVLTLDSLKKNKIKNVQIGNQKLVLFITESGNIHCLDAFCAHMGLNLATGSVQGEELRCQFHHWSYLGNGEIKLPCKSSSPKKINSYPVIIRYGLIWIWPGDIAAYELPYHQDLPENSFIYQLGESYSRPSHPHISLLNALDIQHVNSVHALDLKITNTQTESADKQMIHYDFSGEFLTHTKKGKLIHFLTGGKYFYSVRYVGASVGYLKALEGIKIFGKFSLRPMYATFGYRPEGLDKTVIQPIFLTLKKPFFIGWLQAQFYLYLSRIIYTQLKNEDGVIYENIRFTPHLTKDDSNILKFINHVNHLEKSNF